MEQIPNAAMSHDFGYVLFVVSTMRSLGNPQLRTGFGVCPWHNPVEPLLVAVDSQDFRARLETPSLLHTTTKDDLFQLIVRRQSGFDVLGVQ